MTDIKEGELFRIYLQLVLMGILAVFYFLYAAAPIGSQGSAPTIVQNAASTVSSSDASFITGLMPDAAGAGGFLPNGAADLFIIASIVLIPLTIMNSITALRFIKDIATQWV